MCGIFGQFGERGTAALARAVLADLAHRGPDGEGIEWFEEGMMAHTRLAIIDGSPLGRQPMANTRGTVWITYNGEIYNYLELREELQDYPFRTRTDTEVILAAYERWGLECLHRLRGMFAFGLWDGERRRLLCATDRFGIKPLYYVRDGARFIFSSEVKPLTRCGVPLRPDPAMLYDYLADGLLDHGEQTLFEGIAQLRPGTFLTSQDGRLTIHRYWDLDGVIDQGPSDDADPAGVVEAIERRLSESVRLHLRGDVEVGLSLSSGLDSNVLRALVLQCRGASSPLACFTYAFPGTPYDEVARLRALDADDRCQSHQVELTADGLLEGLQDLVGVMEGPVGGVGIYGYWRNAKLAADHGIKVLLDGQGADEIFAGYRYYYDLKLQALCARGEGESAREEFHQLCRVHGEADPGFTSWLASRPAGSVVMAPDSTTLGSIYLHPEFAASYQDRPRAWREPFGCPVKNAMYRDLFFMKIPKLLRFQDKCGMAWGLEVRVPYLDHPLVEELFRVPTSRLLEAGELKALLRDVAIKHLSERQLRAPKLYVASPQREWVKTALRAPIEAMIQDSVLAADGYIVRDVLWRQFQEYVASPELGNSFFVWKFLNLELWYRTFCQGALLA